MAIENVWIIDGNSGICIYDWCTESKEKTIDEQLVSGLLLAFRSFSSEAGLVDISAIEGIDKKLAYQTDDRFIIAAICHSKDYEPLINKTLQELLSDFRRKYKNLIDEDSTTDVTPFRTFHEDLESKLEGTTANRSKISLFAGALTTLLLVGIFFVIYYFVHGYIEAALQLAGVLVGMIIIFVGFFLSGFIGGLVAGDRRYGIYSGISATIPIYAIFMAFLSPVWISIWGIAHFIVTAILFFGLILILNTSGGLVGGFRRERRYLYPLDEEIYEEE